MDVLVNRYYNINRLLLLVIGSWPMTEKSFINSVIEMIQSFFVYVILISSILVQIFKLITSEPTLDLFVNVSSYAFLCMVYLAKYGLHMFQLENILQAMNSNKNYNLISASVRVLNAFVRIVNIICYMFGIFYYGQKLIDCSTNILEKAYTIPWYLTSSKIKFSLMMVLQRSLKKSTLFIGNLFPMSLELFGTILKTTSCYITTLHALQY
ncbi:hypothetical protein HZH68_005036 [Vespula germanica]|uniref:Uncharacterized protein n=1 Tax=Vespula germanica TaxID=30212 RepID=A0A834KFJ2_VESGE|nr:hypothetical protein HZH68_005036 [Vespula germanica]